MQLINTKPTFQNAFCSDKAKMSSFSLLGIFLNMKYQNKPLEMGFILNNLFLCECGMINLFHRWP